MPTITAVRQSLENASSNAKAWFLATSVAKGRKDFFAKGKLGDDGTGAVYAYFGANDEALYVGEASRPIKRRMHDETSPHKSTAWWESWHTVRFLQVPDRTDRLALELLLILSLQPTYNSKPGARAIAAMFSEET